MLRFLLTVLCLTSVVAKAQLPYKTFGDSLARWSQETGSCDSWTSTPLNCFYSGWVNDLGADTLINGLVYKKVGLQQSWSYYKNEIWGDVIAGNYQLTFPGALIGGIREDSLKKIWFRRFDNSSAPIDLLPGFNNFFIVDSDVILYDFNIQVGDTLPWKPYLNVVEAIDSVQLATGEWRRLFNLGWDIGANDYWIEGIGAATGLFGSYWGPPFEHVLRLDCYKIGDSLVFQNGFYNGIADCETIYIGVDEVKTENNVSIFPNPAYDQLTITSSVALNAVSIYDVCGRQVYSQSAFGNRLDVDLTQLPLNSCYFLRIRSRDGDVSLHNVVVIRP
jgi:hypothetical protein